MNAIEPVRGERWLRASARPNVVATTSAEMMVTLLAPMLRDVARRYESDVQRRRDLQQEMLIALWLSLDTFEESSSFRAWVKCVAHEVGEQHIEQQRSHRRSARLNMGLESPPNPQDPESILATRERAATLLGLLNGLCPRERDVVLLELQEFELDEMSRVLGISRTQVRETLIRARRRLVMRMKRTELRSAPEGDLELGESTERESSVAPRPRRASAASGPRASRSSRERGGVYFIEPMRK